MKARTTESSRRQFTRQFYRGNHLNFSLALTATLAGTGLNLAISWLLQQTVDLATGTGAALTLPQLVLFTLGLLAVCLVIDAVNAFARPRFLSRAIAQYREYAYSRLLNKNLSAFSAENSALYLSALSNDTASIETNYLQKLFEFTGNALLFAGSLAMMLWYSVPLTAVALVLSALPLVVAGALGAPEYAMPMLVALLLILAGTGVYLLVDGCVVRGSFDRLLREGDFTAAALENERRNERIGGVYWPVVVAAYLLWSFLSGGWHYTWVIWPAAALLFAALSAALNWRR